MLAESHPLSIHLSIHPSISPPPLPRRRCVGSKDGPHGLTHSHTHAETHTSAMCHYQFHLPLPVIPRLLFHLPTLALFPLFFPPSLSLSFSLSLSLSLSLHPCLSSTSPPTRCVSPLPGKKNAPADKSEGENREKSQRGEDSESWSVCEAQRCLHPP